MAEEEKPVDEQDDVDALEKPEVPENSEDSPVNASDKKIILPKKPGGLKAFLRKFNIYLLLFLFVLVLAGVVVVIAYFQGKQGGKTTIKTGDLSASTLSQLATSDATVGEAKQTLSVQANAVFAGKVLVRNTLEVGGNLQVNGGVSLSNITVTDSATLGQVQVGKNLAVAGDAGIQGQLSVAKGLQVTGNGTFSGSVTALQITTGALTLNGDLVLTHHITAGGPQPTRSSGAALGAGGTASVSGSDTSGSVSINTGSGAAAGCFVAITFAQKYNDAPHVIATPIGSDAGKLDYYITRSSTGFSICDASAPPAGASFAFDYFVVN
jgi:cytoskeletal protein CcmA (bactofilin family)